MSEGLQIWLDPEKYGSLRPLWQDSYIWSPVAVDESLPLHQTSFLDIDEEEAKEAAEASRRKSDSQVLETHQQQTQKRKSMMAGHRRDASWNEDEDARTLSPGEEYQEKEDGKGKGSRPGSQDRPKRYTGVRSSADRKPSPEEDLGSRRRPVSYPPPEPKPGLNKRMKSFHLMKDRDELEKPSVSRTSSRRTPRTIPEPEAADKYDDDDDEEEDDEPVAARIPRRRRTRKALSNIEEGKPMTSAVAPEKEDYFEQGPPAKTKGRTADEQQPLRQQKSDPELADEEPAQPKPRRRKQTAPSSLPSLTSASSSSSSSIPTLASEKSSKPTSPATRTGSKRGKTTRVEAPPLKPSTSTSALPSVTSSKALAPLPKPSSKKGKSPAPPPAPLGVMAPMPSRMSPPSAITAPATPAAGVGKPSQDNSRLTVRLDLNLDIEVELKAKIEGDLTLTLFD